MHTLSLAMIVKNEAEILGRVLACAKNFCQELIIVDTGSTDETIAIAEQFSAKVFHFQWIDDFAAARNFSFAQCTGDWIIWLDADDVVPIDSQQKIRELMQQSIDSAIDTIVCNYDIAFSDEGRCTLSMPRERMIRRTSPGQWESPIHESFVQPANSQFIYRSDIHIEHHKPVIYQERSVNRNLHLLENSLQKGDRSPRNLYYYGKELLAHNRIPEAISAYQEYVSSGPSQPITSDTFYYQALLALTTCHMELNQMDVAKQHAFTALQANSARAEAYLELGIIYYRQQQFSQAIPLLVAATHCQRPSIGSVQEADYSWRPYHYLSLCYEALGQNDLAIQMAIKALPTMPDRDTLRANIRCFANKLQ